MSGVRIISVDILGEDSDHTQHEIEAIRRLSELQVGQRLIADSDVVNLTPSTENSAGATTTNDTNRHVNEVDHKDEHYHKVCVNSPLRVA